MAFDGSSWPGAPAQKAGGGWKAPPVYRPAPPVNPGKAAANAFRGKLVVRPRSPLGWRPPGMFGRGLKFLPYFGAIVTAIELWDLLSPPKPADPNAQPQYFGPPGWNIGCVTNPLRNGYWNTPDRWWYEVSGAGPGCGRGGWGTDATIPENTDSVFTAPSNARGVYIGETWQHSLYQNRVFRSWYRTIPGPAPDGPFRVVYPKPRPPVFIKPQPVVDPYVMPKPGSPQPAPIPTPFWEIPYAPPLPDPLGEPVPPPSEKPKPREPGVIVIPGVGPNPDVYIPIPYPNPVPVPKPGTVPAPAPTPGTPNPQPDPTLPGTTPSLPGYISPAPATGVEVRPGEKPAPYNPPQGHVRSPPRPREKEKKVRIPAAISAIMKGFGIITETLDMIDVVYKSIPCQDRYFAGLIGNKNIKPWDKAEFISRFPELIDERELIRNYAKNQFEDAYYGLMSPEKAYYQGAYNAWLGPVQGGKFHKFTRMSEEEREAIGMPPDPVIKAFNDFVDDQLGPVPKAFTCCAGKKVTCGGSPKKK